MQLYSNSFDVIKILVCISRVFNMAHLYLMFICICLLHKIMKVLLILLLILLKLMVLTLKLPNLLTHRCLEATRIAFMVTLTLLTTFWTRRAIVVYWWHQLLGNHSRVTIPVCKKLSVFKFMWEKLVIMCITDITWSAALYILVQEFLKLSILLNLILIVHDRWLWEIVITYLNEPIWRNHSITTLFCSLPLTNLLHIIVLLLLLKLTTSMNTLKVLNIFEVGGAFENWLIYMMELLLIQ